MADRYFVEHEISADRVVLVGPDAHHLAHVMRGKPGDRVTLFDGRGAEFAAQIRRVGRTGVELAVIQRRDISRELPGEFTLAVALPKGERQRWLVEKCTELGVTRLIPLVTARSVAQPTAQAIRRLGRTVVEASKQCGRNRLLAIGEPRGWDELLADPAAKSLRLLAHPGGGHWRDILRHGAPKRSVLGAVGPEGGWTDEETAHALAAGWQMVNLGNRLLRVETAAIMLAALVAEECLSDG